MYRFSQPTRKEEIKGEILEIVQEKALKSAAWKEKFAELNDKLEKIMWEEDPVTNSKKHVKKAEFDEIDHKLRELQKKLGDFGSIGDKNLKYKEDIKNKDSEILKIKEEIAEEGKIVDHFERELAKEEEKKNDISLFCIGNRSSRVGYSSSLELHKKKEGYEEEIRQIDEEIRRLRNFIFDFHKRSDGSLNKLTNDIGCLKRRFFAELTDSYTLKTKEEGERDIEKFFSNAQEEQIAMREEALRLKTAILNPV